MGRDGSLSLLTEREVSERVRGFARRVSILSTPGLRMRAKEQRNIRKVPLSLSHTPAPAVREREEKGKGFSSSLIFPFFPSSLSTFVLHLRLSLSLTTNVKEKNLHSPLMTRGIRLNLRVRQEERKE